VSATVTDHRAGRPSTPALRVLVVDDQAAFRDVVAEALTEVDGFTVVGSLPGADGLIDEVTRLDPDLVLLDVRMPGEDGVCAALRLRRERPELTVVLMSVFDAEDVPAEVLAAGIGFLPKEDLGPGALAELRDRLGPRPRALP
jgi:DNA-binding NarL/FixJ family response regulator